jgi:ATP-dependent RNA helicase SUPV3L1/SUV3
MSRSRNIVAVLGPTNTGKTHYAIEQMLAHKTGMMGLPLRLLAREVFDRICERVGMEAVGLVTGEEKIIPANPRFWICTVEAMPTDLAVEFLAVDEIQLCADFERGHVFTDRLLHRRGTSKTMFLGADTMRDVLGELVPDIRFETRTRLSNLTYAGQTKVSRLPPRSAIVGFSAEMVYSLAELVRRQRGGAAVIMGNLSPRTRNAQVGLYQSGEVDYLVATDAIGMGLNMDIEHVAFATTRKFDGFSHRQLTIAELGQIAGRAGRYKNDGTFGVTGRACGFDLETVEYLEGHLFAPVNVAQWRNRNLNFSTLDHLAASFKARPNKQGLVRARPAADIEALEILSRDEDVLVQIGSAQDVERLWEVCQLPDYRNISAHDHASLIARIFRFVSSRNGVIDTDWFDRQLSFCDRIEGDIDTLSNRISHIRTWTFVANRSKWLDDPLFWQGRAREIEDRLSDALHEALTQRFIDRRTSLLMKKLRQREDLMSSVEEDGAVKVEGDTVGYLSGFRFSPNRENSDDASELKAAAKKAVEEEIAARAASITAVPDQDLLLDEKGKLVWQGHAVGQLSAGEKILKPVINLLADDALKGADRDAVQFRLQKFLDRHIASVVGPLLELQEDENITGLARGVAFQIVENLGVIERDEIAKDIKALDQAMRGTLRKHGIRFGAFHIFLPILLKPAATQLRVLLWGLKQQKENGLDVDTLPEVPGQGLTSAPCEPETPSAFFQIAGYKVCGKRIVRIDMLERLGDMIRQRVFWRSMSEADTRPEGSVEGGGFTVIADMMSLVGCSGEEFSDILKALGYVVEKRQIAGANVQDAAENDKETTGVEKETEKPANTGNSETVDSAVTLEVSANVEKTEAVVEAAETPETAKEFEGQKAGSDDQEPTVLDVWWPKDTGPFRRKKKSTFGGKSGKKRPAGRSGKLGRQAKPVIKNKRSKSDPKDSPFAALAALKNQLKK